MAIFNQWPWTNFREYNLDWVIRTVKSCQETVASVLEDVSDTISQYFADHIDTTLSVSGDAADAAVVGAQFDSINSSLSTLKTYNIIATETSLGVLTATLTAKTGLTIAETASEMLSELQAGHVIFVNIHETMMVQSYSGYHLGYMIFADDSGTMVSCNSESFHYEITAADGTVSVSGI